MRVIDCECGTTIKAANDEELERQVSQHMETEHDDTTSDAHALVAARAYDASDA